MAGKQSFCGSALKLNVSKNEQKKGYEDMLTLGAQNRVSFPLLVNIAAVAIDTWVQSLSCL